MANGDAAAAKGWDVVPPSDDVKVGYDEINYTRDLVANEMDARVTAVGLKLDASKIQIADTENPEWPNGTIWLKPL